ncbi:MAG TPA: hypothetical protein VGN81_06795 [Pseudonocardiaceae bacterium]|jgi:hypothetical protein
MTYLAHAKRILVVLAIAIAAVLLDLPISAAHNHHLVAQGNPCASCWIGPTATTASGE